MKKKIPLLLCIFLIPILSWAQESQYTITGTVVHSQTGEPLAGANIQFEDLVIGTSANTDGEFRLRVTLQPGDYRLNVTFIGFKRNQRPITLGSETEIDLGNIPLQEDIIGTEELVVTGASALTSKKQLGNTIGTVDAEELENTGATSIDRALAGKISGALVQQNSGNPAGGISVRLRGTSTLLGSADPLYIVDGVIVNNDSPILVTLGGYAQNRLVDINPEDIERIEVVKGAAAAALYGSRANNGVVQIFTKDGRAGEPQITISSKVKVQNVRETLEVNMAQNDQGQFLDNSGNVLDGERYDFQDYIFRTAIGTDQYLSVAGGTAETQYFVSGSYLHNQGIIDGSNFQRATGRLKLDQELNDWARISFGTNYTYSDSKEIPNGGLNDDYGALTGFIFGPNTFDPRPDPETGEYPQGSVLANPVEVIDKYDVGQTINRILGNARLDLIPTDELSIDYTLGLDTYNQIATFFIPVGTTAPGLGEGYARRAELDNLQLNNDLNFRYQDAINPDIESTTLVGGTLQYEQTSTIGANARQFTPFIETVNGGSDFDQPGESRSERIIYGVFAQQTFGLWDKLYLTGAGRFDASSAFGQDERWQFYPKVSGSYLLSEERFWKESLGDAIPTFKLRASWGQSGGLTALGAYDRFTRFFPNSINGQSSLVPSSSLGAIDVKPERQTELELGIDASFLQDRLAVEFTWYDQHTEDLLLTRTLAPTTGFGSRLGNFGTLDNTGIEILVRGVPVNNGKVQWTSSFTFSQNENEVDGIENDILPLASSFGQVAAINGEPLGTFYSDAFERDANGDIVYDEDGLPVEAAGDQIIGDPNPDFTGSFINDVKVGSKWSFRSQFDFVYGNDVFNFTRRLAALSAFGTLQDPFGRELEGELPAGYSARVFGIFENWIEDGSYIKLRELSVSYTATPEFLGLRSVKVSLIGRNLLSFDNYSGYDPETNAAGQRTAVRGFDFVEVPIPRSFQLGVTAKF